MFFQICIESSETPWIAACSSGVIVPASYAIFPKFITYEHPINIADAICSGNGSGQPAIIIPARACAEIVESGDAIVELNKSFVCFGVLYCVSILDTINL